MNTIINLILKFSGAGRLWQAIDGYKSYGSASLGILTGLLGVLNGMVPYLTSHDLAGLWGFITRLPMNDSWLLLVASFGGLGVLHKWEKSKAALVFIVVLPEIDAHCSISVCSSRGLPIRSKSFPANETLLRTVKAVPEE